MRCTRVCRGETARSIYYGKHTVEGDCRHLHSACDILIYLHGLERPIIHRDIKPQNIIVKPDGKISLIDFDTARVYQSDSKSDTQFIGTREYAPPEQYGFSQTDARTDIYSVGVVLGWLLTGKTDAEEVYRKAGRNRLTSIYKKCTAFSPEHRFDSAKNLKAALIRSDGKQKTAVHRWTAVFVVSFIFAGLFWDLYRFFGRKPKRKVLSLKSR